MMSIYCWGRNSHGELGSAPAANNKDDDKSTWSPQIMLVPHLVSSVAAGDGHTLFSTESGDVYACGRGKQGQLGLTTRDHCHTPTLVTDLSHESVVRVAASGVSSYAITATGRVYQWGLVHRPDHNEEVLQSRSSKARKGEKTRSGEEYDQVTAGQLTGLAEDQDKVVVKVDVEARAHTNKQQPEYASRRLTDIVTDSTERWMLANDDADAEYYRELQSMGYEKEELDEKMQDRGKEYHGMLRIKCKRVFMPTPELISSLRHVKVVSIAAGFAHCLALTDQGVMYSCGYNDRGQLGIGHRISSSEFKIVDYMQGKVVLQVECGQQHSMCRAISRTQNFLSVEALNDSGNKVGASVYVWGNGMLGQLGLGLKGTSKGRLLPTLLTTLCDVAPLGAIDIAAGGNFSVAVGLDGSVYSWGHAGYNQHGSSMVGGSDYVDNHYFFVPRPVSISGVDGSAAKIVQVSCGANFTVACSEDGNAYSWGWNAYGVLGHGKGYFGQSAMRIDSLGQSQIDRRVTCMCAGSSHVLTITASSGNTWAKQYDAILPQPISSSHSSLASPFSDVEILDEASGTVFPCHQVVLAARSPYFAGYFRVAAQAKRMQGGDYSPNAIEQIILDCPEASSSMIHHLLQYIYTDTLSAPAHKRKQLAKLAEYTALHRLASLCRQHSGSYADRHVDVIVPPSSFESDMSAMVMNEAFSDCKFIVHVSNDIDNDTMSSESQVIPDQLISTVKLSGHRVLFKMMPYFNSLFSGGYSDGSLSADGIMEYDLTGFFSDGIDISALERLIRYAYTGAATVLDVEDSNELMSLLLASNRVGLFQLTQLCEKRLSLHLNDFPENAENCYYFAQMYNIPRLSRQCEELINHTPNLP